MTESIMKGIFENHKVILCDLDGTIITTKSGKTFPVNYKDWKFKEGAEKAIKNYNPDMLLIVTNQGGIARKLIKESEFRVKLQEVMDFIKGWGIPTVDALYCATEDKNDPMRKPNPGMIEVFRQRYGFENSEAIMLGDASGRPGQFSDSDLKAAENAGINYMDIEDFIKKYE